MHCIKYKIHFCISLVKNKTTTNAPNFFVHCCCYRLNECTKAKNESSLLCLWAALFWVDWNECKFLLFIFSLLLIVNIFFSIRIVAGVEESIWRIFFFLVSLNVYYCYFCCCCCCLLEVIIRKIKIYILTKYKANNNNNNKIPYFCFFSF